MLTVSFFQLTQCQKKCIVLFYSYWEKKKPWVSYLKSAISFSSEVKAVGSSHPIEILLLLHTAAQAVQGGWERAGKEEWSLFKRVNMISLRKDKTQSCCWLSLEGTDRAPSPCPSRATWSRLPGGKIFFTHNEGKMKEKSTCICTFLYIHLEVYTKTTLGDLFENILISVWIY